MKNRVPGFSYDSRRKIAEFRVFVPGTVDGRRRLTVSAETRDEALSKWKAFRDQVRAGQAEPLPFSVHVARVWPLLRARLSKRNGDEETRIVEKILKPFFRETRLDRINRALAQDFIAGMEQRGYSADYVCRVWRLAAKILHDAVDREMIPAFPIRGKVKLPKAAKLKLEMSPDEQAAFLAAFDDEAGFRREFAARWSSGRIVESPRFSKPRRFGGRGKVDGIAAGNFYREFRSMKPFFVAALHTGLDRDDLRLLKRTAVRFGEGAIRVPRQKTDEESLIPISATCRAALEEAMSVSVASFNNVFTTAEGKPFSVSKINRAFTRAKVLAGITRRCRLKDLRHTFGSNLASAGVSLQKIAKAMGHASTRTTERYAKPSLESLQEIASALDSVISDSFSDSSGEGTVPGSPQVLLNDGAGNGARTRDIQLGKLTLYQLSYARATSRNIAEAGQRGNLSTPTGQSESDGVETRSSRNFEERRGSRIFAKRCPLTKRTGIESP
jgi:integrase